MSTLSRLSHAPVAAKVSFSPVQIRKYFKARLPKQRLGPGPQAYLNCPFHDDARASLSINLEEGLWKCHASVCVGNRGGGLLAFEQLLTGCDKNTAWNAICLTVGIRIPTRAANGYDKPEAVYHYVDFDGNLLYDIVRFPGKRFKMRRPEGEDGWVWNLDGVERVLYNLPAVLKASVVFITEGEKDANTLAAKLHLNRPKSKGLTWAATTNTSGAGNWNPAHGTLLRGKSVFVFEDNDDAGRKHAQEVIRSVHQHAKYVKLIRLPGLKVKGDVSDWMLTHEVRDLVNIIRKTDRWSAEASASFSYAAGKVRSRNSADRDLAFGAPETHTLQPDLVCLADVEPRCVDWLWKPYIPARMLSMISGDPGAGKTSIALALAADLTRGRTPSGSACPPSDVLYLTVENAPAEVLRPRFDALCGNAKRLHLLRGAIRNEGGEQRRRAITLADISMLDAAINSTRARLVVIDPVQSYFGAKVDLHRSNETRPVLDGLAQLTEKYDCAILLLRHITKQSGGKAIHRGLGSIDLTGAVRSELLAGSLPDFPKTRALVHIKSNIGSMGKSVGYEIDDAGQFQWLEGHCDVTAAQLLAAPRNVNASGELAAAVHWLREELDGGGRSTIDLKDAAKAAGFSWATVRRGQQRLGIKPRKKGMYSGWTWRLPKNGDGVSKDGVR